MKFMNSLKAKLAAGAGVLGLAPSALAEGDSYTVPTAVSDGLTKLEGAGSALAGAITPVIIGVGIAFLSCWVAIAIFRYFKRAAR